MSFCIRVYRLDLARVRGVVGSRDSRLLAALEPQLEDLYLHDDENDETEDGEELVTPVQALRQIVEGTIPREDWGGDPYHDALFALYEHLGSEVDDWLLSSHDTRHLQEVETALRDAGAQPPLSFFSLIYRGAPIQVPSGDEPSIGYLEAQEVVQAWAQYDDLSLANIAHGTRRSVERLGGWLRVGAENRNALVGVRF